ncbi:hypothetical protein [Nitratireductor soli]|uniref:hypothetical protein n=1 Tax=Nitratireductor soli TaxID=1670619 RepID=UPI000B0AA4C7|nr:hypothetical protein [Nitratireductor soli]
MKRDFGTLAGRPVTDGGGLAGLMTAPHLAPEPVVLISRLAARALADTPALCLERSA